MSCEIIKNKVADKKFSLELSEPVVIYPNLKNFEINKLLLFDSSMIEHSLKEKFIKKYKKLLSLFMNLEETGENGAGILLGEIEKMESVLLTKYKKHLSLSKVKKMLKELYMLEQETKKKLSYLYAYNLEENIINKSR